MRIQNTYFIFINMSMGNCRQNPGSRNNAFLGTLLMLHNLGLLFVSQWGYIGLLQSIYGMFSLTCSICASASSVANIRSQRCSTHSHVSSKISLYLIKLPDLIHKLNLMLGNCKTPLVHLFMHFPHPFRLVGFTWQIVQLDVKNLLGGLPFRLAGNVDKQEGRVDTEWECRPNWADAVLTGA